MDDENLNDSNVVQLTEKALLSNILSDPSGTKMLTAIQKISDSDFTYEKNRLIYIAMEEINAKGEAPNIALVRSTLENDKTFDKVSNDYLNEIASDISMSPVEPLINSIKERILLSKFVATLKKYYDQATQEKITNVSDFIGNAESAINEIAKQRSIKEALRLEEITPMLVQEWVEQTKDFRDNGKKAKGIIGIETGYQQLDWVTKGWQKSNMIIIGARPSVGKTAFALNLLYKVASRNIPVIFFSLEMDCKKIEERLLSLASNLTSTEIHSMMFEQGSTGSKIIVQTHGDLEQAAKVKRLQNGLDALGRLPFYVDENPGTTMNDISAKCRKLINGQNIKAGLIAIDYLGLIQSSSASKNENRQNQVAEISRQIKQLARDLKIPIIVLSQLSREGSKRGVTDRTPQLTDLRDSGALEQDADMVFFLSRKDYDKHPGEEDDENSNSNLNNPLSDVCLYMAKNRDGQTGEFRFIFDKEHCSFSSVDLSHEDGDIL